VYYGHQVAKLVNCSPDLPHLHLLNCLRDTPLEHLLNTQLDVPEFTTAFGPSVDGVIIDVGTAETTGRVGGAQSSNYIENYARSSRNVTTTISDRFYMSKI